MKLIDLSRDIYHRSPTLPNHPPVTVSAFWTHADKRVAEGVELSIATLFLTLGDHSGTHIDAPRHFDAGADAETIDEMPLEKFFTEAVCLDLSHKPLKSDISVTDLEAAEQAAGIEIKPGDTVFLHMGFNDRVGESPAYVTDFPGLTRESAEWLGHRGIGIFGVEALSPGRPFKKNFEVHIVCREMGFTHIEGLANLDKLVNQGRFRFIGFPLKIRGGTGSPIRAVAWLDS
ncbi:MAG TPA: cyclase family protein [Vicinamibacterales bacterium]|nr:cyclase family protein [Vicinamibacterales bacterium]